MGLYTKYREVEDRKSNTSLDINDDKNNLSLKTYFPLLLPTRETISVHMIPCFYKNYQN